MSLAIPKKKKIIRVIIIIASFVDSDLDQDIEGTIFETVMRQISIANVLLFEVNDWDSRHEEAWTAFEAIHAAFEPEAVNQDLEALSETFGNKLSAL